MNGVFTVISIASAVLMCICAPDEFLPAALKGGSDAAKCALTLFAVYVFWMGVSAVAEECGITARAARLLAKPCKRLFKTKDEEALTYITMNISCNMLGIGGAATPYGVKAVRRLEAEGNLYAQNLLFVVNASSLQLIPATVIALRASLGSAAAYDIAAPTFLASAACTILAVCGYVLYEKIKTKVKSR